MKKFYTVYSKNYKNDKKKGLIKNKDNFSSKLKKESKDEFTIEKKVSSLTNKPKEEEQLDNFEINNLEYDMALKLDKRNFCEIYWSILRREHIILFTLFSKDDHNIIYIKYCRLIFLYLYRYDIKCILFCR